VIFDFFRSITTTFFKPPKPTMERLERRQEEWGRKYMPYATPLTSPKPTPPSLPPHTPARVVKPPSPPTITPPRIDIMGFSQQIRGELRREGVPVWYYTGKLQVPTPQKVFMGIRYITGFASKLAERAERKYESIVVQPVLAKVAPEKFAKTEGIREWSVRRPTERGFEITTYRQKIEEIKPAPLSPAEQVKRGVVGGLLRTPIALTGIPILRMGFKGIATPSGLKKEFIETGEYIKKRPYEFGAETATTILAPYAYKKLPVRPTVSVAEFPRGRIASLGIEIKKLHGEGTFKPLVSFAEPPFVRKITYPRFVHPEEIAITTETTRGSAEIMLRPNVATPERFLRYFRKGEVWHASESPFKSVTEVLEGSSPTKGLYVSPKAYPRFLKIRGVEIGLLRKKIIAEGKAPTLYKIKVRGVKLPKFAERMKLPEEVMKAIRERGARGFQIKKFASLKSFVERKAPRIHAYISPEALAKIRWKGRVQVEAVIPHGAMLVEKISSRLFPKYTVFKVPAVGGGYAYVKVPIREFYVGRPTLLHKLIPRIPVKPKVISVSKASELLRLAERESGAFKPISLGMPKWRGEVLSMEAYTPQTPFERGIALEYMQRKAPFELGKIEWGIKSQQIIKGVRAKPRELGDVIRDVVEKEHNLPEGVGDVVIKELKRAKARVYGSVMQEAIGRQFGVKALPRTPRDIDVQVRNPAEFAKRVAEAINKKAGREVVKVEGESVIVKSSGEKLFDIHPIGFGEISLEGGILAREGGYLAYGFKAGKLIKTREGIRTTTLSEQALRKFGGAVELRAKPVEFGEVRGYIAPAHAGRVKDIFDYFFAGKATAERLRMLGKYGKASELEFRLNRWIESWGEGVAEKARKMWEEAQKQGRVKVELGAFEGLGMKELMRPSLGVAGKSTAISASVFAVKSPFTSSLHTTSPAARSAFTSLSNAVRGSGLVSRSVSRGVSRSVVSSVTSATPSPSISRSISTRKSTSPLTSSSSSVFSVFLSTSSVVSQMSRGSVSRSEFSKFSKSVSKASRGGKSISSAFFSFSARAEYPKWKRRKREEFEFRKMLEEGVASKFLKITPIATPEELLKGVLRR